MRAEKKRSLICILITAVLLLSGICFDQMEADFSLISPICSETLPVLRSAGNRLMSPDSCTNRMLGRQDSDTVIGAAGRTGGRTVLLTDQTILSLCSILQGITLILLAAGTALLAEAASHTVIITYIHQKDGKKS